MRKSEKREKAFNAYISGRGKISKAEIARCFGVTPATVSRWSNEDGWNDTLNALVYDKDNNIGRKSVSALLPKQTAEIMNVIQNSSGQEILWQNILLQYAAIIRAQQLMDVENQNILHMEKREINEGGMTAKEWENHTPWERYKIFLDTQSKAMNSLTSMLKKFDEYKRNGLVNDALCAKIAIIKHKAESFSNQDSVINVVCNIPEKSDK